MWRRTKPSLKTIISENNHLIRRMYELFDDIKAIQSLEDADMADILMLADYGDRMVSPLLESTYAQNDFTALAKVIHWTHVDNWNRLYDAFLADYNPIENYRMTETEEHSGKTTLDGETVDDNERNLTSDISNYGFNSNAAVPTGQTKDKDEFDGKVTRSDTTETSGDRELTRSGNIGVTTSQQMIESEIKLRRYNLIRSIIKDIANEITCPYYVLSCP